MALASLIVRIGGDLTGLNKALTQADKDVQKVGKKLTSLGKDLTAGLTVPIVGAGVALAAAAVHVGEFADRLLDLVDMTGLSSDTLQEFRHVATMAGVETDTLADAAIKLTTKLSSGGEQTKELTGALGKLGLSAMNGRGELASMDTLLPQIIGRLQGMTDITTRNTIAADIFGKSWSELAPILGMGAGAMAKAQEEARKLGLVMSKEDIAAADAFRKALGTLKASAGALTNQLGVVMLPVMTKLVDVLQKDVVPGVRSLVKWFDELSPATKTTIGVILGLTAAIGPLLVVLGSVLKFIPLLRVAFLALGGPIGLTIAAVGLLTAAGLFMLENWESVKVAFVLLWMDMKDAVFKTIDWILGGIGALVMKIPALFNKIVTLRAELDTLAKGSMAASIAAAAALVAKLAAVGTAAGASAGDVAALGRALDKLPTKLPKVGLTPGTHGAMNIHPIGAPDVTSVGAPAGPSVAGMLGDQAKFGAGREASQMIQAAAMGLGPFAALIPIINGAMEKLAPVLEMLIEPLVEIGRVIGDALAPILKMLVPVIQLVADIFLRQLAPVLKVITWTFSIVMEALGLLVKGIGQLIDSLPFVSAKGVINAGQEMIDAARAARKNAAATDNATDSINSFASALSNIPRVLNINALRHMVSGGAGGGTGTGGGGTGGGGGGGGGKVGGEPYAMLMTGNVYITVPGAGDPALVAEKVGYAVQRIRRRGGLSRLSVAVAT